MNDLLFEYKVRARHRLGWKEFSFYADTDIEEFLNRNSIEYVRNITDTVEHKQLKEIERLNNIIKEVREYVKLELSQGGERDIRDLVNGYAILEILDKENKE